MAIRTANKRAYLRGEGMKMQEWGISTVIINRRHGACGRCADFVGMVFIDDVYAGGKPSDHGGKYPLLSDAMKSGLFHPRCKDSSSLYIEGISTPPDREVLPKKAQEDLTEIERAEQKATYGKRMEKMNRRLSKYALDPDNKKMYRARAEQWAEYTEKWQSYHEKQLAKAEKSGIIREKSKLIHKSVFKEETSPSLSSIIENKPKVDIVDYSNVGSRAFSPEARKRMLQTERIISGNDFETGILYDANGKRIFAKRGDAGSVRFSKNEIKQMKGGVLTHNHPDGTVFSPEDINMLRHGQLAEIRACNGKGAYVMRCNSSWNKDISDLESLRKAYWKCDKEIGMKYRDIAAQEGKSILYYLRKSQEESMELFAKRYGLEFAWEPKS